MGRERGGDHGGVVAKDAAAPCAEYETAVAVIRGKGQHIFRTTLEHGRNLRQLLRPVVGRRPGIRGGVVMNVTSCGTSSSVPASSRNTGQAGERIIASL